MGYAIELYFDRETEKRVSQLWDELAAQDVSAVLPSIGSRPHISLAVLNDVVPSALENVLRQTALAGEPIELNLAAVGTFPTAEGVVFLAPSMADGLIELYREVYRNIQELGLPVNPYYRPGRWVPHCTVASDVSRPLLYRATEITLESGVFGPAQLRSIGLIEFRPVHELFEFNLGGNS